MSGSVLVKCATCPNSFERPIQRGRPATRCPSCRAAPTLPEIQNKTIAESDIPGAEDAVDEEVIQHRRSDPPPEDNTPYLFRLMVGNMKGLAHGGESEQEAMAAYRSYCKRSQEGFGQIGFERVQLWKLDPVEGYKLDKDFTPERGL
jgi:hypothetical protein